MGRAMVAKELDLEARASAIQAVQTMSLAVGVQMRAVIAIQTVHLAEQ